MDCIKNGLKYDIDKKSEKLHLLTGLKKILLDIDKAISIIRHTEKEEDVIPNIMLSFGIDKVQAEYVAEIKLRNLNKEYILNRTAEIEKLIEEIDNLTDILGSDSKVKKLIEKQLIAIKNKYGKDRLTTLISDEEIEVYDENKYIEDYPLTIFTTREGYIKKVSAASLRFTTNDHKLKEDDEVIQQIETTNISELLFFSDKSTVYKMKTHELNDTKVSAIGDYLPSILGLDSGEKIIYTVVTKDFSGNMLFGFENGKIAKVPLSAYETKSNRKKLISAYSDKAKVCDIKWLDCDKNIVTIADNNKAVCVDTEKIPLKTTKSSQGVQVMKLTKKGAKMIKVILAEESNIENLKKYTTKNIPAAGSFLTKDEISSKQVSLFE